MRKYEPIWIQLKETGKCQVSVPKQLHARIKKAVSKEKYNDTAYKVQWDMINAPQPELTISTDPKNKSILTFKLTKPILLGDL